ncbi:PKD domain-containing protein, partial [Bacteroidota bacterium]
MAQYQVNNDASQTSCNCFELTPDAFGNHGSVWNVNLFDLTKPTIFSFDVFLGCDDNGADGIAFVFQPLNVNAGSPGAGIGYGGITPSLGVEIDTYQNTDDPVFDHIAIQKNGDVWHGGTNRLAGPVQAIANVDNIEDCAWHVLIVDWDPVVNTMTVYFDDETSPRLTYTGDIINDIFGGNPNVYWGFTSATGGAKNQHQFCNRLSPDINITSAQQCEGVPVDFESASAVSTGLINDFQWDFGDGTTGSGKQVSHVYSTSGSYNVTLTITSEGCTESETIPVIINASPNADVGSDLAICAGNSVQLSPVILTAGATYAWTPATGLDNPNIATPTANPANTTVYSLKVTSSNGCSDTDDLTLSVNPLPNVDAGADGSLCQGETFQLGASGAATYSWSPSADLNNSTIANPIFSGTNATVLTVTGTDANNCVNTDDITLSINPLPVVDAGPDGIICFGKTFQLNASGATTYSWSPSVGLDNSSIANPIFSGSNTTVFTVTGTDANNCTDTDDATVTISQSVTADFTFSSVCEGDATSFTDLSTVSGGAAIISWQWDFGDGSPTVSTQNPTYNYGAAGAYPVELSVEADNGCVGVMNRNVSVNSVPTVSITGADACLGDKTVFQNNSSPNDNTIVSWDWDFGDLQTASGAAASHTYLNPGQFVVTLTAVSDSGCTSSGATNATVFPNPEPAFAIMDAEGCAPQEVLFTNQSTIATGTNTSFNWLFGDGNSATGASPVNTYRVAGYYDVTLSVTSDQGCEAVLVTNNAVHTSVTPVADFDMNERALSVLEANLILTDKSENATTWNWDLGDGTLLSGQEVSHLYTKPGVYDVILTVTNGMCEDTMVAPFTVNPIISFYVPSAF